MKTYLFERLKQTKRAYLRLLAIFISVLFTEAIVSTMSILLKGGFDPDFLLTGLVASLIVASVMLDLVINFHDRLGILLENNNGLTILLQKRKQAEAELRLAAVVFNSGESAIITDPYRNIQRVNQAFTEMTGYSINDIAGQTLDILRSDHHTPSFYTYIWESVDQSGSWRGELWNKYKNGQIFLSHVRIFAVKDDNAHISHYILTYIDINHNKQVTEEIQRLAFFDPLTNLPNRRLLQDRLKLALVSSHRSCRKGALLFIDLDNFKILNDSLGHDMGDLLLQQVAERLIACIREGDTVARLGGDEFVVVLENLSEHAFTAAKQAETIGNKILATLCQPYLLTVHDYRSTPSMGATLFNGQDQTMDELLKQADIAMYQAKNSGRNTLRFFDPKMQASITARVIMEADLRQAVTEQQFILYYQPQVCHNNRIVGTEVLIRWLHPQKGLIPPLEFIPISEETGLIHHIGLWVLDTACHQIKNWETDARTRHLQIAVNVSALQFRHPDFVEQVCQVLHQTDINPAKLKLELTETMVLADIEDTIMKMNALRVIGVRFSMDDFGTGYSSLSSLKKLPIDQLKIDQSFIRDILTDPDDSIIVQTIIAMANHLGMEVIAEGVETEAQRDFLDRNNCKVCQGYLFGKPMPVKTFEEMLLA